MWLVMRRVVPLVNVIIAKQKIIIGQILLAQSHTTVLI